MSEAAAVPDTNRLEAIAAATKEYAEYSRDSFGLAGVVGALLLVGRLLLVKIADARWDATAQVLALAGWFVALGTARRWYQRKSAVVAPGRAQRGNLVVVYLSAVWAIAALVAWPDWSGPALIVGNVLAMLVIPVLFSLGARSMRGLMDSGVALMLMGAPQLLRMVLTMGERDHAAVNGAQALVLWACGVGFFGLAVGWMAVAGVQQHLAFHRLEQRLAELRGEEHSG